MKKPIEKGGRIAQRGFKYQNEFIASKCIEMINKNNDYEIYCDYYDDCLIIKKGGCPEIYQIKSGDEGIGPWTLNSICKDKHNSIIYKLYKNYLILDDEKTKCFFISNKDANKELLELKQLLKIKDKNDHEKKRLTELFNEIIKKVEPENIDSFTNFLKNLNIDTNSSSFNDMGELNKSKIKKSVEKLTGHMLKSEDIDITYKNIIDLINKKSSESLFPLPEQAKITKDDILSLTTYKAFSSILLKELTEEEINSMDHTQLETKMRLGKFDDLLINSAKRLRVNTDLFLSKKKCLPKIKELYDDIYEKVGLICSEAHQKFKFKEFKNSMELYDFIKKEMKKLIDEDKNNLGLDMNLLLGIMFDITSKCGMRWIKNKL